ncbi:MAG: glutathione S-transferase family protein [Burkholderiales bacterium]
MLKMYDLAGADESNRFSPYCWRVRMALAHKSLECEFIPWRFTEKDRIAFSGQGQVPVLVDGETAVCDSWKIALYLESRYPQNPLFGCEAAKGQALFVKHWVERTLHPLLVRIAVRDVWERLHEKDKAYFRESREKRFGMPLEQVPKDREQLAAGFRTALDPVRATLEDQPYLCGNSPGFADYMVFSVLQWGRCASRFPLLEETDAIFAYRERMLDLFDGAARRVPAAA